MHTTYIKTYARMRDGSIKFFKDGYTDLRGRFDYLSLNTSELDAVDKFAILILNEDYGAIVREAAPPKDSPLSFGWALNKTGARKSAPLFYLYLSCDGMPDKH